MKDVSAHPKVMAARAAARRVAPPPDDASTLTPGQVAHMLQLSLRTVWRMEARGDLPKAVRYGRKTVRWSREAIEKHIEGLR